MTEEGKYQEIMVVIPLKQDIEELGVHLDEKLKIYNIERNSLADGKLKIEDEIKMINGVEIRNRNHFHQLLRYAPPVAYFKIYRWDCKKDEKFNSNVPHIKNTIDVRDGYIYMLIQGDIKNEQQLGLVLRDINNRVFVVKCESNSWSNGKFEVYDHIINIEGTNVSSKTAALDLFELAIQSRQHITCIIERPITEQAKHECNRELFMSTNHLTPLIVI